MWGKVDEAVPIAFERECVVPLTPTVEFHGVVSNVEATTFDHELSTNVVAQANDH